MLITKFICELSLLSKVSNLRPTMQERSPQGLASQWQFDLVACFLCAGKNNGWTVKHQPLVAPWATIRKGPPSRPEVKQTDQGRVLQADPRESIIPNETNADCHLILIILS
jgi:hypothetical protein